MGSFFGGLSAGLRGTGSDLLHRLLGKTELHPCLVNGSDYPVIAVDPVQFRSAELIDELDVEPLRSIFRANALLFDYVLKRRLRTTRSGGRQ